MNANWITIGLSCLLAAQVQAQFSLEAPYRCTGSKLLEVFEPQRGVLQTSSALIQDGREESGYGVVHSKDGHILTKASEFTSLKAPVVIIDRKKYQTVKLLGVDSRWDLALIKVEAEDLVPVEYAPSSEVALGTWVVANGVTSRIKRRLLMGVISAQLHRIPPAGGLAIGVVLKEADGKLEVEDVSDKGGAVAAGVQKGDVIVSLADKPVAKIKELAEALEQFHTGYRVPVGLKRGDQTLTLEIELFPKHQLFPPPNRNDQMSGDFSKRRSDFPRILQHSILGSSKVVGGPLLDLDGRCLGMNIARANRAESFAIPVEDLKEVAARLMAEAQAAAGSGDPR